MLEIKCLPLLRIFFNNHFMAIKVCPICGSRDLKVSGDVVASKMMLPGKYKCVECGYVGFPLELDSEEDAQKFRKAKKKESKE